VDDDEYLESLMGRNSDRWGYHEICKWLPYKPETVEEIAQNMVAKGYRNDRPIITYEGLILDGRHRYEAALKVCVDPIFVEFQGTRAEAIDYVTSENVARRHLNNAEKEFFYVQRAEALGVRTRADNQHPTNVGSTPPSAKEHAEALGVSDRTVERWEDTRKEIKSDPELADKATTPEGYKEAKKEVQQRRKESCAAELQRELNNLTDEEKVERLGGAKPIDAAFQRKLDEYLGHDFNPNHAATGILILLNRLRLFGGKKEIGNYILSELQRSVRMQKYEAEALLLLADVINENYDRIVSYTDQKPNLKVVN